MNSDKKGNGNSRKKVSSTSCEALAKQPLNILPRNSVDCKKEGLIFFLFEINATALKIVKRLYYCIQEETTFYKSSRMLAEIVTGTPLFSPLSSVIKFPLSFSVLHSHK